jgi:hypothetical protein
LNKGDIPSIGTKVKLTLHDILGDPYEVEGKIDSEPYHHGYHSQSGCGWFLYGTEGDTPCYKIHFIPKRKRRTVILMVKDIVSISDLGGAG